MRRHLLDTRSGLTMLLALAVFVVAAGFCVLDHHAGGGHGHGVVIDFCLAMLGVVVVVAPSVLLTALGWAMPFPALALVPASLHVLDPPPKRFPVR